MLLAEVTGPWEPMGGWEQAGARRAARWPQGLHEATGARAPGRAASPLGRHHHAYFAPIICRHYHNEAAALDWSEDSAATPEAPAG